MQVKFEQTNWNKYRFLISALCITGAFVSALALHQHVMLSHGLLDEPPFCNISEHINCTAVNGSAWSQLFGVPIASYGLAFYLFLLVTMLVSGRNGPVSEITGRRIALSFSIIAVLISIVLFLVSELAIGALCILCAGTYLVNFLLLIVAFKARVSESFVTGLATGAVAPAKMPLSIIGANGQRIWGILGTVLLIAGIFSILKLPAIFVNIAERRIVQDMAAAEDPVTVWRSSPRQSFNLVLDKGPAGDYIKGSATAPIQLVEYADFECPGCRRFHGVLDDLLMEFNGKYGFVFRNFPLDMSCNPVMKTPLHKSACLAAFISRCAGEQGKYWESTSFLFSEPMLDPSVELSDGPSRIVESISTNLGLDREALKSCVDSKRYQDRILEDIRSADSAGLQGTPALWVNGRFVPNSLLSPDNLRKILSAAYAEGMGAANSPTK